MRNKLVDGLCQRKRAVNTGPLKYTKTLVHEQHYRHPKPPHTEVTIRVSKVCFTRETPGRAS